MGQKQVSHIERCPSFRGSFFGGFPVFEQIQPVFLAADNQLLHQSSEDGVLLIDPSSNTTTVLISSTEWTELGRELGSKLSSVVLSADRQMALLVTNREQVCHYYRRMYRRHCMILALLSYTLATLFPLLLGFSAAM